MSIWRKRADEPLNAKESAKMWDVIYWLIVAAPGLLGLIIGLAIGRPLMATGWGLLLGFLLSTVTIQYHRYLSSRE